MSRIKLHEAMQYLGLSKDSFDDWCNAVRIVAHKYEFSSRKYFLKGEFFAKADVMLIQRLREIHGENWSNYYPHYNETQAFLDNNNKNMQEQLIPIHSPKYTDTNSFLKRLKK